MFYEYYSGHDPWQGVLTVQGRYRKLYAFNLRILTTPWVIIWVGCIFILLCGIKDSNGPEFTELSKSPFYYFFYRIKTLFTHSCQIHCIHRFILGDANENKNRFGSFLHDPCHLPTRGIFGFMICIATHAFLISLNQILQQIDFCRGRQCGNNCPYYV